MDIKEIMKIQHMFDKQHGWSLINKDNKEKLNMINKDLIGIMGEIGEFSNLIKKLNMLADSDLNKDLDNEFTKMQDDLEEELIDAFIYLIRIATHLNIDVTAKYLNKLNINKGRFTKYEIDNE